MEAIYSCETSADFQRTTQLYIPEDGAPCITPAMITSDRAISIYICIFIFHRKGSVPRSSDVIEQFRVVCCVYGRRTQQMPKGARAGVDVF
jgi:hypothetical protein